MNIGTSIRSPNDTVTDAEQAVLIEARVVRAINAMPALPVWGRAKYLAG